MAAALAGSTCVGGNLLSRHDVMRAVSSVAGMQYSNGDEDLMRVSPSRQWAAAYSLMCVRHRWAHGDAAMEEPTIGGVVTCLIASEYLNRLASDRPRPRV
jgi:hypothetical protein